MKLLLRLIGLLAGLGFLALGGLTAAFIYLGGLRLNFLPQPGVLPVLSSALGILVPVLGYAVPLVPFLIGWLLVRTALSQPQAALRTPQAAQTRQPAAQPPQAPRSPRQPPTAPAAGGKPRRLGLPRLRLPSLPRPGQRQRPAPQEAGGREGLRQAARTGPASEVDAELTKVGTLLRDVPLPDGSALESVLVGIYGLLVLKQRAFPGSISVQGDRWFAFAEDGSRQSLPESPSSEATTEAEHLSEYLRRHGLGLVSVNPLVVITAGELKFMDRPGAPLVELRRFQNFVNSLSIERPLEPRQVERILSLLQEPREPPPEHPLAAAAARTRAGGQTVGAITLSPGRAPGRGQRPEESDLIGAGEARARTEGAAPAAPSREAAVVGEPPAEEERPGRPTGERAPAEAPAEAERPAEADRTSGAPAEAERLAEAARTAEAPTEQAPPPEGGHPEGPDGEGVLVEGPRPGEGVRQEARSEGAAPDATTPQEEREDTQAAAPPQRPAEREEPIRPESLDLPIGGRPTAEQPPRQPAAEPRPAQPPPRAVADLPPGPEGVAHVLRSLPRAYVYLQGVDIGGERPPIRHVLVGPHGVLVMTVIGLQGDIACEGKDWYRIIPGGERKLLEPSPSEWLERDVEAVREYLTSRLHGDIPIKGTVVIAGPNLRYMDKPASEILDVGRLRNYVPSLAAETPLLPERIQDVVRTLQG